MYNPFRNQGLNIMNKYLIVYNQFNNVHLRVMVIEVHTLGEALEVYNECKPKRSRLLHIGISIN